MNNKHWFTAAFIGAALLVGCAKRPPPPPPSEPTPPQVETPAPEPTSPVVQADTAAQRRARIQARIGQVFKPVYFAYDQSTLSENAKATAGAIAQLLQEAPEISVRIEGHADEQGTNEYNLALGERRAQAVQSYFASYGISASRVSVLSYGEEKPASEGKDESAWSLNRRAEFVPSF